MSQLLVTVLLLAVPIDAQQMVDVVAFTWLAVFISNVFIGPLLVWVDLRSIRSIESVEWGGMRFLHIFVSAAPLGMVVYLMQRREHLHYAMLVDNWDTSPEELRVAEEDKTVTERLADKVYDTF